MMTQVMVFLLLADAAVVAVGLLRRRNMGAFIAAYWVMLTVKNAIDFLGR